MHEFYAKEFLNMAVTIKDVAALARVSPSTVSRVCNDNPSISKETAEESINHNENCTGNKHRMVAVTEKCAEKLTAGYKAA